MHGCLNIALRTVKSSETATIIKDEVEPIGGFVGDAFIQAYRPIVQKRRQLPCTDEQREFQLYRRAATWNSTWSMTAAPCSACRAAGAARAS